jgi:hypothetical protein
MSSRCTPFIGVQLHADKTSQSKTVIALKGEVPEINHFQLFTHGPANANQITIDPNLISTLKRFAITFNVHGSYLCVPWKSHFLFKHTMDNFRKANAIGAKDVVIHIPYLPIVEWLPTIVKLASQIKKEKLTPKITLETAATIRHHENSYESPPKLNRLWRSIKKADIQEYVGFCIDTAHNDTKLYLDMINPECIFSIHLNGNSIVPGIHKTRDVHEIPLHKDDLIWGGLTYEQSGCRAFIEYAAAKGLLIIVEWNRTRHTTPMLREFINRITSFS